MTIKTGAAVTQKELVPYLKDAIVQYNGCYNPDDDLFNNVGKVQVDYCTKVKP